MGIFDIFKKKKLLELPEPPTPPEGGSLSGDFPSIRGSEISRSVEFSSLPSLSSIGESSPDIAASDSLNVETSKSPQLPATPMVVKTLVQESPVPSKMRSRPVGQLYVSINDYQAIVGNVQNIQRAIQQSEEILVRAEHAKDLGERELESWKAQLEDVERKLNYADSIIAKTGGH